MNKNVHTVRSLLCKNSDYLVRGNNPPWEECDYRLHGDHNIEACPIDSQEASYLTLHSHNQDQSYCLYKNPDNRLMIATLFRPTIFKDADTTCPKHIRIECNDENQN